MKKIVLTLVLLLTLSFTFASNNVEKDLKFKVTKVVSIDYTKSNFSINHFNPNYKAKNKENILETITAKDCWAKADAAEKAYCGYVGCNTSYWLGYMAACEDAKK